MFFFLLLRYNLNIFVIFFFSSRRRHTRSLCDWSSDVCSSDLSLRGSGVLHLPDPRSERHAAFLVLHGFGSNKDGGGGMAVCKTLTGLGYAALRFDFRGCGESEGERGRVICKEQ